MNSLSPKTNHPVLDTLERTRLVNREDPTPHPMASSSSHATGVPIHPRTDVVDQILEQSESIPIPSPSTPSTTATANGVNGTNGTSLGTIRSPGSNNQKHWESLASKSTNQLSSKDILEGTFVSPSDSMHEYEHDKPSVLPEILPGFKTRMADIHHASAKSVQQQSSEEEERPHPAASPIPPRRLSKSSILYESAPGAAEYSGAVHWQNQQQQQQQLTSKTLVTGGTGDRRWSHELSPEKAGLVGSLLETAGLFKDVVLDKFQAVQAGSNSHTILSTEEKQEAARLAFGGSEESGDQNIYLEGLEKHLQREQQAAAKAANAVAANATTSGQRPKGDSTINSDGAGLQAKDVLGSAPAAGWEHQRSLFHLAANPESRKSMLLDHPESLGYHARDPTLNEDSVLATQHRLVSNHDAAQFRQVELNR